MEQKHGFLEKQKNKGWQCLRGKYSRKSTGHTLMLRQIIEGIT